MPCLLLGRLSCALLCRFTSKVSFGSGVLASGRYPCHHEVQYDILPATSMYQTHNRSCLLAIRGNETPRQAREWVDPVTPENDVSGVVDAGDPRAIVMLVLANFKRVKLSVPRLGSIAQVETATKKRSNYAHIFGETRGGAKPTCRTLQCAPSQGRGRLRRPPRSSQRCRLTPSEFRASSRPSDLLSLVVHVEPRDFRGGVY
jgi:hypothetical protein